MDQGIYSDIIKNRLYNINGYEKLLVVLASAYEPLRIDELSYLTDIVDKHVRLVLISIMDLLEKHNEENDEKRLSYTISDNGFRKFILSEYQEELQVLINEWILMLALKLEERQVLTDDNGEIYLHAYIIRYMKDYMKQCDNRLSGKAFIWRLFHILQDTPAYREIRTAGILDEIYEIYDLLPDEERTPLFLSEILNSAADAYLLMTEHLEHMYIAAGKALEIRRKLFQQREIDVMDYVESFYNYATSCMVTGRDKSAIAEYTRLMYFIDSYNNDDDPKFDPQIISILAMRAYVYNSTHKLDLALKDYEKIIQLSERFLRQGRYYSEFNYEEAVGMRKEILKKLIRPVL